MEKAWGKHGENSMDSLESHGARAKFHVFHGDISMLAWNRKIVKIFPMKAAKAAWNIKPWKAWKAREFTKMKAWEA